MVSSQLSYHISIIWLSYQIPHQWGTPSSNCTGQFLFMFYCISSMFIIFWKLRFCDHYKLCIPNYTDASFKSYSIFKSFLQGILQVYEQFCILSMNAQRYSQFKSTEGIAGFIEEYLKNYLFPSPRLTLVVYGQLKLRKEKVSLTVI